MATDLEASKPTQVPAEVTPDSVLAVINRAMTDPSIDAAKLHSLMDLQERMMAKQAEIAFNLDLQDLQNNMPRITKDSKIMHSGKLISSYASYEAIDAVIRPLLQNHGFSIRYNSEPSNGKVLISSTLSHRAGHSITNKIELGIDSSGAKNNVQGMGSTIAYGKRYLIGMMLNIVFEGEDDDGGKAGKSPLNAAQIDTIEDLLQKSGADRKRFLDYFNASEIDGIDARQFDTAVAMLQKKVQK